MEPKIEPGQVWVSLDRRDNGREARVISVIPMRPSSTRTVRSTGGGFALMQGSVRRTTVKFSTLRQRYRLKEEPNG